MNARSSENLLKIIKTIVIVFALVSVLLFFYQSIRNHNYENGNDLTTYFKSSQLFYNGENPFTEGARPYIYPLFLVIVVYPLSLLQSGFFAKAIAVSTWSAISYFAFFMTILACLRFLYGTDRIRKVLREQLFPIALAVLILHPFLQDEFLNGQVNLIVLGCAGGFFLMLKENRQLPASVFLAVAASIKIAPAVCLVYVLFSGHYRCLLYFPVILLIFILGLPLLINSSSLGYYHHLISEVYPRLTVHEAESGFKSFSLVSTIFSLTGISAGASIKIGLTGFMSVLLLTPVYLLYRKLSDLKNRFVRLTVFSAIVVVIPLVFPMSEPHHLLILTIPVVVMLSYWESLVSAGRSLLTDRISLLFISAVIFLQVGHAFKDTPLRLMGLLGIYFGLLLVLRDRSD
jgi:hypothetical protein